MKAEKNIINLYITYVQLMILIEYLRVLKCGRDLQEPVFLDWARPGLQCYNLGPARPEVKKTISAWPKSEKKLKFRSEPGPA